jgi:hypothetical protein
MGEAVGEQIRAPALPYNVKRARYICYVPSPLTKIEKGNPPTPPCDPYTVCEVIHFQ